MRSSRLVFEWLLTTLEIGRAILAIRRSIQRLYTHYRHPRIADTLESIKSFFEAPSEECRELLLSDLKETIAILRRVDRPNEKVQLKRFESLIVELALIRTVLLHSTTFPLAKEDSCR